MDKTSGGPKARVPAGFAVFGCAILLTGILFTAAGAARRADSGDQPARSLSLNAGRSTATAISAGVSHSCALLGGGAVKCWGDNTFGQLGDGTRAHSSTPVAVSGLRRGVVAVSTGYDHSCALLAGGAVKCWGENLYGQLGDGTRADSSTPVAVSGLRSGVAAISAGGNHSCALLAGGAVECWGSNGVTTTASLTPVAVSGLRGGVVAISAGFDYSCALLAGGGAVKCWGENLYGQLGDGTRADSSTPVAVSGLRSGVAAISAGGVVGYGHTCALLAGGAVECWGGNGFGELGNGTTTASLTPVAVSGPRSGAAAISVGSYHTCALLGGGAVKCWGENDYGQLGDRTTIDSSTPVAASGLRDGVAAISAGGDHSCALLGGGAVKCWGDNTFGQLGDGTRDSSTPVAVSGLRGRIAAISAGFDHSCALLAGGAVKCWGDNRGGQLGGGTRAATSTPVAVSGLRGRVSAISAGFDHSCALLAGGAVKCWGNNRGGQLGDGTTIASSTPVAVSGLSRGVVAISTGDHSCALLAGGEVKCWGHNGVGQLGDGTRADRSTPVAVSGLSSGVVAISAGDHTCALLAGGAVKCWGNNDFGQLGDGTRAESLTPVAVSGLHGGVVAISAGVGHSCALLAGGAVKCWGHNDFGQLGDGTRAESLTPVAVSGLRGGVVAIRAGGDHTCALLASDAVKCWGNNYYGELGERTTAVSSTPVAVSGLRGGVAAISAGFDHSCALLASREVKCWGNNDYGELGERARTASSTPVAVSGP